MKKITSVLLTIAIVMGACIVYASESEFDNFTKDGLMLWVKADTGIVLDDDGYVETWEDQSGKNNHLTQTDANRRPEYFENSTGLSKAQPSVGFETSNYLASDTIGYSGDSTVIIYYKMETNSVDRTIFSSSKHTGSATRTEGKIPFTLSNSNNDTDGLQFVMANETSYDKYSTKIPRENESFMVSMFVIDSENSKLTTYNNVNGDNKTLDTALSEFSIAKTPYYDAFALGLKYDTAIKARGMLGEVAEVMIYNRALSKEELNQINRYLKIKYDISDKITGIKMNNSKPIMYKGEEFTPDVTGIIKLMDIETESPVSDLNIISENPEVVSVLDGKLIAKETGKSLITITCGNGISTEFVVTVPALKSKVPEISNFSPGGSMTCVQEFENIENCAVLLLALYKSDTLVDFKYDDEIENGKLEIAMNMPEDITDCRIQVSLVDSLDTMIPLSEQTIFNQE